MKKLTAFLFITAMMFLSCTKVIYKPLPYEVLTPKADQKEYETLKKQFVKIENKHKAEGTKVWAEEDGYMRIKKENWNLFMKILLSRKKYIEKLEISVEENNRRAKNYNLQ